MNWSGDSEQVWITRFATGKGTVRSVIRDYLPNRLTDALLSDEPIADKRAAECSRTDRTRLIQKLTRFTLPWTGHEGYRKSGSNRRRGTSGVDLIPQRWRTNTTLHCFYAAKL